MKKYSLIIPVLLVLFGGTLFVIKADTKYFQSSVLFSGKEPQSREEQVVQNHLERATLTAEKEDLIQANHDLRAQIDGLSNMLKDKETLLTDTQVKIHDINFQLSEAVSPGSSQVEEEYNKKVSQENARIAAEKLHQEQVYTLMLQIIDEEYREHGDRDLRDAAKKEASDTFVNNTSISTKQHLENLNAIDTWKKSELDPLYAEYELSVADIIKTKNILLAERVDMQDEVMTLQKQINFLEKQYQKNSERGEVIVQTLEMLDKQLIILSAS